MHPCIYHIAPDSHCTLVDALSGKKQVPFSMAIGNAKLMHENFKKHLCMGTTRIKVD